MDRPRRTFGATAVVLLSCVALSISGCAQADPPGPPATTESTPTTAGAPDAAIVDRASKAYLDYLSAGTTVLVSGGDPDDLLGQTSTSALDNDNLNTITLAQQHRFRIEGQFSIRNGTLKSIETIDGVTSIEIYACLDGSEVSTFQDGTSTKSDGESRSLSSVVIKVDDSEGSLQAAGMRPWDSADFCQ